MSLAFAYSWRTVGNAASQIAKAFLQYHFHIEKDYLNRDLLIRGNHLPERLRMIDARDAGRAKPLHRCNQRSVGAVWRHLSLQLTTYPAPC